MSDSREFYSNIDLNKNELKNGVMHQVSSFPPSARKGQIVFHTVFNDLYVCIDESGDTTLESHWDLVSRKTIVTSVTASTPNVELDSIPSALSRVTKWIVAVSDNTNTKFNTREVLAIHNDTTANHSEYAIVGDSISTVLSVNFSASTLKLLITNNEAVTLNVTVLRFIVG